VACILIHTYEEEMVEEHPLELERIKEEENKIKDDKKEQ
jgi:hypothetical protein